MISLNRFANDIGRLAGELERSAARDLAKAVRNYLLGRLPQVTPRSSGEMAGMWKAIPGRQRRDLASEGIGNAATHALIIDRGRRRSRTGRMLGSLQARRGVVGPERRKLNRGQLGRQSDRTVGRLFR